MNQTVPTRYSAEKEREFHCDECGNRCTRGLTGTEYGHSRGNEDADSEPCSRRPDGVDPRRCAPDHDDWQTGES